MAGPGRLSLLQICGSYKSLHIYSKNKDQEGEVTLYPQRGQMIEELDLELEYPKSPKGLHILELAPTCLSTIPLELPVLCLLKGTGVPMLVFPGQSYCLGSGYQEKPHLDTQEAAAGAVPQLGHQPAR